MPRCARARARTSRRCGRRRAAAARHARAGATAPAGVGSAVKSGSADAANSSICTVSFGLTVHTAYTSRPPGRTRRGRRDDQLAAATRRGRGRRSVGRATAHPDGGAAPRGRCTARRGAHDRRTARADRRYAAVGDDRRDRMQREAIGAAREQTHAPGVDVGRDDEPVVAHPFRDRARLAARCRGEIEHALPRLRVEHRDDGLTGLILGRRPTFAYGRERADVAGVAQHQRVARRARRG